MDYNFKKAQQSLDSLPFKDRLKAVGQLVKNTLTIVGRDQDFIKPWIRMAIYHFFMVSAFFYGLMAWQYELFGWVFLSFMLSFFLFLYKHFYNNRQELRMSWIVYEVLIGNDPSYKDARKAWKELKSHTRKLAWMDIGMALVEKGKWFGSGFVKVLINLFISGLEEVWDLINHYLLPSVAVDRLDIKPGIQKMKKLKEQVPESLVGVFGIDFIGSVVRYVTIPTYIILFIISVAIGYFGREVLPASTIEVGGDLIAFSWLPVIVALYIGKLFSNLFERIVTSVKVVYFTIFYTKITHPDRIMDELQDELMEYLKLDPVEEVDNLEEQNAREKEMPASL